MRFTRRGLFGFMGGAAAAKVLNVKWLEAATPIRTGKPAPTFKITREMGPPFHAGDVVKDVKTHQMFLVKQPEAARVKAKMLGLRGPGKLARVTSFVIAREADPGWRDFRRREVDWPPSLVAVPFLDVNKPGIPLEMWDEGELVRVGTAHDEGRNFPL